VQKHLFGRVAVALGGIRVVEAVRCPILVPVAAPCTGLPRAVSAKIVKEGAGDIRGQEGLSDVARVGSCLSAIDNAADLVGARVLEEDRPTGISLAHCGPGGHGHLEAGDASGARPSIHVWLVDRSRGMPAALLDAWKCVATVPHHVHGHAIVVVDVPPQQVALIIALLVKGCAPPLDPWTAGASTL